MYSQFERQKDKRGFNKKREIYTGPQYGFAPQKINPQRRVKWNEDGLFVYEELGGSKPQQEE